MINAIRRAVKATKLNEATSKSKSGVIAHTVKNIQNPPKIMQHRSKRDREREEQLKYRDIAKRESVTESVYRGDWVRHPENQWNIGQIQSIDNDQALVTWKKIDKRKKAVSSTHHVKDLQHARREFSQLKQPTHHKESVSPDILPKSGAGQLGTDELRKTYQKDTPGQNITRFKDYKLHK